MTEQEQKLLDEGQIAFQITNNLRRGYLLKDTRIQTHKEVSKVISEDKDLKLALQMARRYAWCESAEPMDFFKAWSSGNMAAYIDEQIEKGER